MSSLFQTYLNLGFKHIADISAIDHILFIVVLCAIYQIRDWKKVLILATAFTIGHSITLALSAMDVISFPKQTVELLIPVTIFVTSLYNILISGNNKSDSLFNKKVNANYFIAMFFGTIHGMAYSGIFKAMLMPGEENIIVMKQLFAFNLGIELAQVLIVTCILIVSFIALNLMKIKHIYWNIGLSTIVGLMAVKLFLEQL